MNEIFAPPQNRPTTNAAEGLPRWRWTTAEVERLAAAGFFHEDERLEPGSDALLVVEVADTSLRYDLNTKAQLYAVHGVPEYWVIHAGTLVTTVHRRASANSYTQLTQIAGDMELIPELVPELAVTIAKLLIE